MLTAIAFTLFVCTTAEAQEAFHPSRMRLLVHGGYDLSETTRLEFRFIPAGNLLGELAPITLLGAKFKVAGWLLVEPYVGWKTASNEPLVSLTFNPSFDKLWAWTEVDVVFPSWGGYWFVQVEYKFAEWFHAGLEGEGWGNYKDAESWSHGGGANALFRFGKIGMDLAVHLRGLQGVVKPEFFLRVHLFL